MQSNSDDNDHEDDLLHLDDDFDDIRTEHSHHSTEGQKQPIELSSTKKSSARKSLLSSFATRKSTYLWQEDMLEIEARERHAKSKAETYRRVKHQTMVYTLCIVKYFIISLVQG